MTRTLFWYIFGLSVLLVWGQGISTKDDTLQLPRHPPCIILWPAGAHTFLVFTTGQRSGYIWPSCIDCQVLWHHQGTWVLESIILVDKHSWKSINWHWNCQQPWLKWLSFKWFDNRHIWWETWHLKWSFSHPICMHEVRALCHRSIVISYVYTHNLACLPFETTMSVIFSCNQNCSP